MERQREEFRVEEEEMEYLDGVTNWEVNGGNYVRTDKYISEYVIGEMHNIITKRESDGRYFRFRFVVDDNTPNNYYDEEWVEVFWDEETNTWDVENDEK